MSIYTTWVNFLIPIVGLSTSIIIPNIKMYISEDKQNQWISSIAGLSLCSYVIFTTIVIIFISPLSKIFGLQPIVLIMLCLHCCGMTLINFIVSYYIQYQKTILQLTFTIGISLLTSICTLALLYFIRKPEYRYLGKIFGFAIPNFAVGILAIILLFIKGKKLILIDAWKYALPICIPIIFHQVSNILLSQSDKVMIQMILEDGVSHAGIYGFAYIIASIGTVVWAALNNAWTPFYYDMLKSNNYEDIIAKSNNYLNLYTYFFAAFMFVIPEVALIMGGKEFVFSNQIIPIIHIGNYFIFLYSFAINFKIVKNKVKSIAIGTISAGICNIVLNIIFIPKYGMVAAAYTSLASYILLFLFHHVSIPKDNVDYLFTFKFYFKGIITMAISLFVYILIYNIMWLRWGIAILIGVYTLYTIFKRKSIF